MTDGPSPYAPPVAVTEERAPPRAAGRAVVFQIATFVQTLVVAGLWNAWLSRATLITDHPGPLQLQAALSNVLVLTGAALLFAHLSDRVPLWGTRREGYLMLAFLIMAGVWLALAFASQHGLIWFAAVVPFILAASIAGAAIAGALAEIGQRRAATGRLAAAQFGLARLAVLASGPLEAWSNWAAFSSITLVGLVSAGICLTAVLMIAMVSDDDTPPPEPAPRASVAAFLRSPLFRATLPLLICAGAATVPDRLLNRAISQQFGDQTLCLRFQWRIPVVTVVATAAYLMTCRRLRFATLLRLAMLTNALAIALCGLAFRNLAEGTLQGALTVGAVAEGLVSVAVLDLALRIAPRGREAFGTILVACIPRLVDSLVGAVARPLQVPVERLAWYATTAGLAAVIAVSLLPRVLLDARDGRPMVA